MFLPCPHGCGAGVELQAESVTDGDGVWVLSGAAAALVSADAHGDPACEDGCPLTDAQTAALEQQAAEALVLGPTDPY